jgi:hypothetical protein
LPDENVTTTVDMEKMIELVTKMRADLLKAYEARQGKAARDGREDLPKHEDTGERGGNSRG